MSLQSLSGFRDFYPGDCALREHIFSVWRASSRAFGFSQYDGPPLEPLELYQKKSGDEIVGQLYNFTDKGGREVALRPELTPTFARMAGARHRDYKKPLKWFAIPQLFRYERAQRGRLREHFQWNGDIVGEPSLSAEAELLALIDHALRGLGLTREDYVIRVSDRVFWLDFLADRGVTDEKGIYNFLQMLDKIERTPEDEVRKKLNQFAGSYNLMLRSLEEEKREFADEVFTLLKTGTTGSFLDEIKEKKTASPRLNTLLEYCDALGLSDAVEVDLSIVRGLAYYTGVVFEVHDRGGKFRAIAGGGRYDNLLKLIADVDLPAVGFGMGDVVLGELLRDKNLVPSAADGDSYYLVITDETLRPQALTLAATLRAGGYRADYPLSAAKVGKQFQAAEERGHRFALIVGQEYAADGVCGLKTLATREQVNIRPLIEHGKVTSLAPVAC
ncbi:MAG: histidine--tRNA ligase [Verrucomicrobiales bacterium]|jgi:histidyl-tRNA synthetase|nr:histidine--tRNA ligase [Verrucomicrobiales bacterium]